jgi:hypothetical protein
MSKEKNQSKKQIDDSAENLGDKPNENQTLINKNNVDPSQNNNVNKLPDFEFTPQPPVPGQTSRVQGGIKGEEGC